MTDKLLKELNAKFPRVNAEKSELVIRLLTPQEIELVAGGTEHAQGMGSSFEQHGGEYAQGNFDPYKMW